jgi:hypothetical protein
MRSATHFAWCEYHSVKAFIISLDMNPCVADVQEMFQRFWLAEVADIIAILPYQDIVRVFTIFPYRDFCHLPGPPVLVDQLPRVRCFRQT